MEQYMLFRYFLDRRGEGKHHPITIYRVEDDVLFMGGEGTVRMSVHKGRNVVWGEHISALVFFLSSQAGSTGCATSWLCLM
jgi:hypothetical protein